MQEKFKKKEGEREIFSLFACSEKMLKCSGPAGFFKNNNVYIHYSTHVVLNLIHKSVDKIYKSNMRNENCSWFAQTVQTLHSIPLR